MIDVTVDNLKPTQVLISELQIDPITRDPIHVDFYQVDMKKKREGKEGVINNPDRRVMTRIRTFQGEHPKEARYIREQFLTQYPVK